MIDVIESFCEIQRNDRNKTTIVKITKNDVSEAISSSCCEIDENQTDRRKGY